MNKKEERLIDLDCDADIVCKHMIEEESRGFLLYLRNGSVDEDISVRFGGNLYELSDAIEMILGTDSKLKASILDGVLSYFNNDQDELSDFKTILNSL